jgi:methyltransferase
VPAIVLTSLAIVIFTCMFLEARRASRNERAQRARGGIEPEHDVYPVMRVAYPAAFVAMLAEGLARGGAAPSLLAAGAATFAAAKALKWWAIRSLGSSWTFRVIAVPGSPLVVRGPYRVLRHPNYVAVVGELIGVALMTGAALAGPVVTAIFGALMLKRIAVEERTLGLTARRPPAASERNGHNRP